MSLIRRTESWKKWCGKPIDNWMWRSFPGENRTKSQQLRDDRLIDMIVPAGGLMFMAKMPNSTANSASWKMQSGHVLCSAGPTVWHKLGHCHYCEVSILRCWLARFLQGHKKVVHSFPYFLFCHWCYLLLLVFLAAMILQSEQEPSCGPSFMNKLLVFCQAILVHVYSVYCLLHAFRQPRRRFTDCGTVQGTKTEHHAQLAGSQPRIGCSLNLSRKTDYEIFWAWECCKFAHFWEFPGTFLQSTTFG